MVESFYFVAEKMLKKDFWLLFLVSFGIAVLTLLRSDIKNKLYKTIR